jgi:hypothetical protein
MARRLNTLHYIFVGVMCGACVYLWTHNNKQVRKQVSVEVNKESQVFRVNINSDGRMLTFPFVVPGRDRRN